jgi:hypothetical protein
MKSRFFASSNEDPAEGNVYADKSALILDWLFREGMAAESFSLRGVVKEVGVSLGLAQRVFSILELKGILRTEGIRTAKSFFFKKPKELLTSWLENYNVTKKCKFRTYRSAFHEKKEFVFLLSLLNRM